MNDLTPFKHGEEGTHHACATRIRVEKGNAACCTCLPHGNCDYSKPVKKTEKKEYIALEDLELMVADEINIARSEGEKTSRLTSLMVKIYAKSRKRKIKN